MKAEAAARKNGAGGAVEMPGLWKAWKAKGRLPTLSTSPLEISPKGGVISTAQAKRSGKVENPKAGFPLSHPRFRDDDYRFSSRPIRRRPSAAAGGAPR